MPDNYICIGDIHGRADLLSRLLTRLVWSPYVQHKIVFLGDMIDRGPDSFEVLELVKKTVETKNAVALLGNHEAMLLDWVDFSPYDRDHVWYAWNGGDMTIASYRRRFPEKSFITAFRESGHYAFLRSLPLYYETDKVWLSHAPIENRPWRTDDFRKSQRELTWTYFGNEGDRAHDHGKTAVCGHVHAIREKIFVPRVFRNIIFADTGCGCLDDAPLSAVILRDGEMVDTIQIWPSQEENDAYAVWRDSRLMRSVHRNMEKWLREE